MMEENNKIPQDIEELRASLNEFMHKQGTAIGFFASKEWEDESCMVINGKRDKIVSMIVSAYFQNEAIMEVFNDVMTEINNVLESRKKEAMSKAFQLPIVIDKSKLS